MYDTIFTVSESSYVEEIYTNSDGQETMRGVLSYNQDYIRTKAEAYASTYDSSRSANEYVLEWGITSDLDAGDGLLDWQQNADRYSILVPPLAIAAGVCRAAQPDQPLWLLAAAGHGGGRTASPSPPSIAAPMTCCWSWSAFSAACTWPEASADWSTFSHPSSSAALRCPSSFSPWAE